MAIIVQLGCFKLGAVKPSTWPDRALTIGESAGTVTISRHHHSKNVFYDAMQVWEVH
jgi:hypothetical protein